VSKKSIVVIGAGIVGLASAYQLLKKRPDFRVTIFEKENGVAQHQTGRNSGVIHSGIYYKPGSLKAKNCLEGRRELIAFCQDQRVEIENLGKIIVATEKSQIPNLNLIEERGRAHGIQLERVGSSRLKEIEPHVRALEGIWIPGCAIVSYLEVAKKLSSEIEKMGGEILFSEPVESIESIEGQVYIRGKTQERKASVLVNCAGLFSDRIAMKALGKKEVNHRIFPFRGEYYELAEQKRDLVKGLIYPVPDPRFPFLGVHLTRMVGGKVEAGPNAVLAFAREGYRKTDLNLRDCLDLAAFPGFWKMAIKYWKAGAYEIARSASKGLFLRDLQKLVPAIEEKDLVPGGAGIRAQAVGRDGKLLDDFSILEERNMIHVLNAPSPAATASFAIGRQIAERAINHLEKS